MAKTSTRSKSSPTFKCSECGWTTIKWVGRCGECQAWGTVEETGTAVARTTAATTVLEPARRIAEVDATTAAFLPTGVDELDRVSRLGTQTTFFRLGDDPGLGRFLDALARRVGGTVVAPDVDDLGAAVVGRFLHTRRGRPGSGDAWSAGGRWAV